MKTTLWICFFIGFAIFGYSLTVNKYTNPKEANMLVNKYYEDNNKRYYDVAIAKLETCKNELQDLGTGICIFIFMLIVFSTIKKITKISEIKILKTSLKTIPLFIKFNALWLLQITGTNWYYYFRAFRGDYPPFADSIGIPIYYQTQFVIYSIIPANIILAIFKYNIATEAFIVYKVEKYNVKSIVWEIAFSLPIIMSIIILALFIADGDHFSIIIYPQFIYILLMLRAGKLSTL